MKRNVCACVCGSLKGKVVITLSAERHRFKEQKIADTRCMILNVKANIDEVTAHFYISSYPSGGI